MEGPSPFALHWLFLSVTPSQKLLLHTPRWKQVTPVQQLLRYRRSAGSMPADLVLALRSWAKGAEIRQAAPTWNSSTFFLPPGSYRNDAEGTDSDRSIICSFPCCFL